MTKILATIVDSLSPKGILARLMAEEKIHVEFSAEASTATFDIVNRVLTCPLLDNMSPEMFDTFLSHEAAHALYTPAIEHRAAIETTTDIPSGAFFQCINIVEDIRIERKIKEKYPGLRRSYHAAYRDMFERNFFGVTTPDDIATSLFADRLNMHYKVGPSLLVPFTPKEMELVERAAALETFADVVALARDVYFASMLPIEHPGEFPASSEDGTKHDGDAMPFGCLPREPGDTERQRQTNIKSMIDESIAIAADTIRLTLPEPDMEKLIVSFDAVKARYVRGYAHYNKRPSTISLIHDSILESFFAEHMPYVTLMVNTFEAYKNAKQYARQRIAKTGELDTNRLARYRLTSDIFRKMTVTDRGKNHGVVLFLDMSSSMCSVFQESCEQIIMLAQFCYRSKIPFVAYGFTSGGRGSYDMPAGGFVGGPDSFHFGSNSCAIRELINSDMNASDFRFACGMVLHMAASIDEPFLRHECGWSLNATPLLETILASRVIYEQFSHKYRPDILNAVFVTDGAASTVFVPNTPHDFCPSKYIFRDERTGIEAHTNNAIKVNDRARYQYALLRLVSAITKVTITNFHIIPKSSARLDTDSELHKTGAIKTDDTQGFDRRYLLCVAHIKNLLKKAEYPEGPLTARRLEGRFKQRVKMDQHRRKIFVDMVKFLSQNG